MRGRKPLPTAIKKLRGNPGRRPLNDSLQPAVISAGYAPRWLSKEAKAIWRRMAAQLAAYGLLTELDRDLFNLLCQAIADYQEARLHLDQEGRVVKSPKGYPILNPWGFVANKALDQATRLAVEFGLSPSARSRLVIPGKPNEPSLSEILFQGIDNLEDNEK